MTTDRIRVGIDLLWLRPGEVGGSEVAAISTLDALVARAQPNLDLQLYAQPSFPEAYPTVTGRIPTRTVSVPRGARGVRVALESTWLPVAVNRDRIDVVHCFGGVVPPGLAGRTVLTVHDVQPLEAVTRFNETNFSTIKRSWLRKMLPRSVSVATEVVVPSEFVRDRLLALMSVDPAKVTVIPHVLAARDGEQSLQASEVLSRFRLDGPFVLFPAITYPHKNHVVLIDAFARLAERHRSTVLVFTGGAGPAENEIIAHIECVGIGDRVRRTGRITTAELDVLMREASLMAFPSRYEGFGLPVLEAMAADTPVVAAATGSLPEVLGDAGVLVDPDDVEGWTSALNDGLDGSQRTPEASLRRRARLVNFGWDRVASQLVDVYERASRCHSVATERSETR